MTASPCSAMAKSPHTKRKEASMENLFRLMLVRPAIAQDTANPSINLTQASPFQDQLRNIVTTGGDIRGSAKTAAKAYVGGSEFLGRPDENPMAAKLMSLNAALDKLEKH